MQKTCDICLVVFSRNKKESAKQWKQRRFCGYACNGKFNAINLLGRKWKNLRPVSKKVRDAAQRIGRANKKVNPISKTKDYRQVKGMEYYMKKKSNGGSFTHQEWIELKVQFGCKCALCAKPESEVRLTIDHIIPVSKGGRNDIGNLQPLCQSCNSRKSNRLLDIWQGR